MRARRGWDLWPLALFLVVAAAGAVWLWQAWPQVMRQSILWQREVNQQMSGLLKAVADNPTAAGGSLLIFSFLYGVLHALEAGTWQNCYHHLACDPPLKTEIEHRLNPGLLFITGGRGDRPGGGGINAAAAPGAGSAHE